MYMFACICSTCMYILSIYTFIYIHIYVCIHTSGAYMHFQIYIYVQNSGHTDIHTYVLCIYKQCELITSKCMHAGQVAMPASMAAKAGLASHSTPPPAHRSVNRHCMGFLGQCEILCESACNCSRICNEL